MQEEKVFFILYVRMGVNAFFWFVVRVAWGGFFDRGESNGIYYKTRVGDA